MRVARTARGGVGHAAVVLLVALAAVAAGCGDGAGCGKGTVEKDGKCVPDPENVTCGPGTELAGGACVASADAGQTDAAGDAPGDAAADATACLPFCIGRECGDDGCGGSCGACTTPEAPQCIAATGQCAPVCVPDCVGRDCGPDGCGGTCGACGDGATCQAFGRCVADAWTCKAEWYGAADACDCSCGAPDPDCADVTAPVAGCADLQACDAQGQCVAKVPAAWTCAATAYAALDACDCGCGVPDPDCKFAQLAVLGCKGQATCNADGTCAACIPACQDKACGSDGCGGLCGTCTEAGKSACVGGQCVDPCSPKPIKCQTATCGDDGCGGTCGNCPVGASCVAGKCQGPAPVEDPTSCVGHCGSAAPAGCYCTEGCAASNSCCPDYATACKCVPQCAGKQCGGDGCGGPCGECTGDKPFCNSDFQCGTTSDCKPKCEGLACGDDGCGGTCGTCKSGETCAWTQQCVPAAWTCDAAFFADELGCDCGCGAVDPDCQAAGTTVFGCPDKTACSAQGLCATAFCQGNAACPGKWCTGVYFQGGGKFAGSCATPLPSGLPPGYPCDFDLQCASAACVAGQCRLYCQADAECPGLQTCVGRAVVNAGKVAGFAPVCEAVAGSTAPCKAQAECKGKGETCVAFVDAKTLGPRYLCAGLPEAKIGAPCAAGPCPDGHLCVAAKAAWVCTLPCPAGDADCPSGWQCGQTALHNAGTSDPADDPKVPVCVPK